ncbi:ABC transporter ATP-binding protein [Roseiflexus castenholzii]|uniref:ABC transporter related n=1 Tax=Roseiflexus castenholzii (strain DSM 13941 / HLO8) TaxID=383372 RepID=A7NPV4_ROSCS|nr:ABC transporter ATP-binding protein [Roseiflexus castenholzii]ABU59600.1 ABC transporter related [Roseiflexus castenholzii DSM 13941]
MGFLMDGLAAEAYDRSYSDRALIRRIWRYFRPHSGRVALVALMVVLGSLVATVIPITISRSIELLTGDPAAQVLIGLAAIIAVMGALGWFFNFVRQTFSARAVGDVVLALREDAYRAVLQRDMSFYDQYASGRIVSRVTSDTQDFATVVTLTIDLLSQLLLVVIIAVVMVTINWQLALITLATGPIVIAAALTFRHVARLTTRQAQRALANVNASIQETVSGIAVAKSFRQEAAIYQQFRQTNELAFQVRLRQGLVFSSIFPILNLLSGIAIATIIYFGGRLALGGSVSVGEWYLFVQSLAIYFFPLTSIASFWSQFQQGLSASERVFALIDAEPKVVQIGNEPAPHLIGRIEFRDVWFTYDTGQDRTAGSPSSASVQWVLPGFSLVIPAGQKLAVVGHTGAGKSSLIKLITRFYEFQAGQLLIDGRDIRALDLAQYRRQIGLVPQSPFLFSGTVADNIRYGRPEATMADVETAARRLGSEWIADLPHGLETDVGERGARLSLGQRQLVALARVLLQNPSIFILDEATASIDPFTETQVQEGLDVVMQGRTSIIIAHRLSTVRTADRIIVLKQGRIIEEGNHDDLLASGGHYAELYNTYFRHQSLDYKPWEEESRELSAKNLGSQAFRPHAG